MIHLRYFISTAEEERKKLSRAREKHVIRIIMGRELVTFVSINKKRW